MELRCPEGKLFGVLADGVLEVKCQSRFCGHLPGVVVIHRFNIGTGEFIETRRFQDPAQAKGKTVGSTQPITSVRPA